MDRGKTKKFRAGGERENILECFRKYFISEEIILSGGAINTPQLLMLSGIGKVSSKGLKIILPHEGDQTHLREVGIETLHHLPGVGQNLQVDKSEMTSELETEIFSFSGSSRRLHCSGLYQACVSIQVRSLLQCAPLSLV